MRVKINLITQSDVTKFVAIASTIPEPVWLTDAEHNMKVSGKSLLGALYTMSDWNDIYVECERDFYSQIIELVAD